VDGAVHELTRAGATFGRYAGMTADKGIARGRAAGRGPDIAWSRVPAGIILSVLDDRCSRQRGAPMGDWADVPRRAATRGADWE
jgi:hypothetical protein